MAVIRQLKNFFTNKIIYPKTVTKAVYDADNGERLDKILRDTMLATDNEEYNGVEPRDADTLGGRYSAEDISAIKDNLTDVNNSLPKKYYGEPNGAYVENVKDCSFILYPNIKRVDFQFVGNIKANIPNWAQLVKIPTDLQISKTDDAYCGTSITYDGKIGMCYISLASHEGYLCPYGISDAAVGQFVKLFGSYYIN